MITLAWQLVLGVAGAARWIRNAVFGAPCECKCGCSGTNCTCPVCPALSLSCTCSKSLRTDNCNTPNADYATPTAAPSVSATPSIPAGPAVPAAQPAPQAQPCNPGQSCYMQLPTEGPLPK